MPDGGDALAKDLAAFRASRTRETTAQLVCGAFLGVPPADWQGHMDIFAARRNVNADGRDEGGEGKRLERKAPSPSFASRGKFLSPPSRSVLPGGQSES